MTSGCSGAGQRQRLVTRLPLSQEISPTLDPCVLATSEVLRGTWTTYSFPPKRRGSLHVKGVVGLAQLPALAHASASPTALFWETHRLCAIERERYYDYTINIQYSAAAHREPPSWGGGRVIRATVWRTYEGRLYRVALRPAPISIAA